MLVRRLYCSRPACRICSMAVVSTAKVHVQLYG